MLGETEEYEPLSRAAYYHAMRKDQEENRNPLQPFPKEREIERKQVKESLKLKLVLDVRWQ
jgi:hypothetical protein